MRTFTIVLLTLTLVLTACANFPGAAGFDVITGSGSAAGEPRAVANFDAISFADDGELIITQNGVETLTIEADDNILPAIETEVRDGTLYIAIRERTELRPVTPIRYVLSVANLQVIEMNGDGAVTIGELQSQAIQMRLNGDGSITAESVAADSAVIDLTGDGRIVVGALAAEELSTSVNGDGAVTVAGEVVRQTVELRGDSVLSADDLSSQEATVTVSGNSSANLWVAVALDVEATGNGSVSYRGEPQITQRLSGDGSVVSVSP